MQIGVLESVMNFMTGCEYSTEVWWWGVIGILPGLGF